MLKFVGVVVVLWFVVLCYLGPTMFQLMEESRRASSELNRINKAIEHLESSNAKLRREIKDDNGVNSMAMKQERSKLTLQLPINYI